MSMQVIKKMLVTEKGTALKEARNQYLFEVDRSANKLQIADAVEQLFNVKVKSVNTMTRQGKAKRLRTASYGKTRTWKRAVVALEQGHSIDMA